MKRPLPRSFPVFVKVAEQYCMSDRARALTVSENMLTANPDLDALFASAEPATVGAAQALKARDLGGKVKFVGFDSSDTIEEDLKAGVIDALVVQDPFNIGYSAVKTILAEDERRDARPSASTPRLMWSPVENLADPEIDKVLHPDLKQYLQ